VLKKTKQKQNKTKTEKQLMTTFPLTLVEGRGWGRGAEAVKKKP